MKPYLIALAIALALVVLIAFAAPIEHERQPAPVESLAPLSAWVQIRGPDGTVNQTGYVNQLRIASPAIYLDITADGDVLFRSGFDQ